MFLAPEIAPPNTTVHDHYSTAEMLITWDAIPKDLENGYLLGYRLFYKRYQEAGLDLIGEKFVDVILDRFTLSYKMTGLQSYTKYEIHIYGYSAYGDGPNLIVYGGNISIIKPQCKVIFYFVVCLIEGSNIYYHLKIGLNI